jgi:hypothetical protein
VGNGLGNRSFDCDATVDFDFELQSTDGPQTLSDTSVEARRRRFVIDLSLAGLSRDLHRAFYSVHPGLSVAG